MNPSRPVVSLLFIVMLLGALFGPQPHPVRAVPAHVPGPLSHMTKTSVLTLADGSFETIRAGAIDTKAGYAYLATDDNPSKVLRVRLADFSLDGVLYMENGEHITSAVLDAEGGYAYFACGNGNLVKVRLKDFSRVGKVEIMDGPRPLELRSGVIDPNGEYGYFVVYSYYQSNSGVVKVRLADMTEVASNLFYIDQGSLSAVAADFNMGNLYAPVYTTVKAGQILKIQLSDLSVQQTLDLQEDERYLISAAVDPIGGYAYFGTGEAPGRIIRVELSAFMMYNSALLLDSNEGQVHTILVDFTAGSLYFGSGYMPAKISRVNLSSFTRTETIQTDASELGVALLDRTTGMAYFAQFDKEARVFQVRLYDFTQVGVLSIQPDEKIAVTLLDTAAGYAYLGTDTEYGRIIKVRLADMQRVASLDVGSFLTSGVIDPQAGYAYFGGGGSEGKIYKLRLSDFTITTVLALPADTYGLNQAAIDPQGGLAYFTTNQRPGKIIQIDLKTFTRVKTIAPGGQEYAAVLLDPPNDLGYFLTRDSPGVLYKVRLSDLTYLTLYVFKEGEFFYGPSAVQDGKGNAYFGTWTYPSKIIKMKLGDLTRLGEYIFQTGEDSVKMALFNPGSGYGYFGFGDGRIVQIKLESLARRETLAMAENGVNVAGADFARGEMYFTTYLQQYAGPAKLIKVSVQPDRFLYLPAILGK